MGRIQEIHGRKTLACEKPDIDNLVKALFDSISTAGYNKVDKKGIVWTDDSIVCGLIARKKYSPNPRIELEIKELE